MWHSAFSISILRLSFGEEDRIISLEPLLLQLAKVEEPAALSSSANTLAKPPPHPICWPKIAEFILGCCILPIS